MSLRERYQLGSALAHGGMGKVLVARDMLLARDVVIKVARSDDPAVQPRLRREIASTSQRDHPVMVPVHDAGQLDDGSPYYAMRWVGGLSLDVAIAECASLGQRLPLVQHLLPVIDAVAYAHAQGVVHRDSKPANIAVGEFGEVVLLDWGEAKRLGADRDVALEASLAPGPGGEDANPTTTHADTIVGTPGARSATWPRVR